MLLGDSTSGLVIEVSTQAELNDAYRLLSNTIGGGRIELTAAAEGIEVRLEGGGDQPVHVTSVDQDNPVTISKIVLREVNNVKVSHFEVDNTGENWAAGSGIAVREATNAEISNVSFESFADGEYDPDNPDTALAPSFGTIRLSHNVTFADNHVSGYYQGVTLLESTGMDFLGNTFSGMQGDGIRMGGVQDIQIEGNHFHDFHGTVHSFNHNDMIQLWSTNAVLVSRDITITGNIFDSGEENGTQTIFMRNEMYDQGRDTSHIYTNIEITDNLIYNSHAHGITVNHADGVIVSDNTVLWNQDSGSAIPRINLSSSWNVTATNNLTGGLNVPGGAVTDGNVVLNYNDTTSVNYVGNHIINPFIGAEADLLDLQLRPDSPHAGTGSQLSDPMLQSGGGVIPVIVVDVDPEDPQTLTFDAGFSVDENGFASGSDYEFEWVFADGSVQTGPVVTRSFDVSGSQEVILNILKSGEVVATDGYNVDVEDSDLLHIDPDRGFTDMSGYASILSLGRADLVAGSSGTVIEIGGTDYFSISSSNAQLHGLQSFGLSIELSTTDANGGAFLRMGSTFTAEMASDGSVSFRLVTNEGSFTVDSGPVTIDDGQMHTIAFSYSNEAGQLVMLIDGEIVDEVAASGTTPSGGNSSLVVGSPWHEVLNAQVGEIYLSADPDSVFPQDEIVPDADIDQHAGKSFHYDMTGPQIQVRPDYFDDSPVRGLIAGPVEEPLIDRAGEFAADTALELRAEALAMSDAESSAELVFNPIYSGLAEPETVADLNVDNTLSVLSRLSDTVISETSDGPFGLGGGAVRALNAAAWSRDGSSGRTQELENGDVEERAGTFDDTAEATNDIFSAPTNRAVEKSNFFQFNFDGVAQTDAAALSHMPAVSDGFGGLKELFFPAVNDTRAHEAEDNDCQGMSGVSEAWL